VRGAAYYVHEAGIKERMVIVQFESPDKAIAARASRPRVSGSQPGFVYSPDVQATFGCYRGKEE
jgi:hypothetical protein